VSYTLEFEIAGLPKMSNQLLRGHWKVKHAHAKQWKRAVWLKAWPFKPPSPLVSAVLSFTRVSSSEPDFDGLVSGFKHVTDGLVECGIIATDKPSCIGQPSFSWEKGKAGKGKIRVKVVGT
jgi:hypothetical protein